MAELLLTDPAAGREHWLELRRTGVTATDITVILGLVSWDSPFALYHRKLGHLPEVEVTWRMRRGSWLEDAIAREWLGDTFYDPRQMRPGSLYASSGRPWQLATTDRVINQEGGTPLAVLECKSDEQRDAWKDAPPARVRAQVLWQMDVLGVSTGHVAADVCGDFRSYTIEHSDCAAHGTNHPQTTSKCLDCPVCVDQHVMRKAGEEFYRRMRGELPPPPVDHLPATSEALKHLTGAVVKGTSAELSKDLHERYTAACEAYSDAKEIRDEMANRVRASMGTAQYAEYRGERIARRECFKRTARKTTHAGDVLGEVDRIVRVKPKGQNDE